MRRGGWRSPNGRRELLGAGVEVQVQTSDDGIMLRMPDLGSTPPLHALFDLTAADVEHRVVDEVGGSALFGARFRMNAGRALLLPRGSPRRRMPLWLQRLKAADLLQAVRQFPSFPILVETYREVMQDAFDLAALTEVVESVAARKVPVHIVETDRPSPFAAGLQFGFVMDWLYAERHAARRTCGRTLRRSIRGCWRICLGGKGRLPTKLRNGRSPISWPNVRNGSETASPGRR